MGYRISDSVVLEEITKELRMIKRTYRRGSAGRGLRWQLKKINKNMHGTLDDLARKAVLRNVSASK